MSFHVIRIEDRVTKIGKHDEYVRYRGVLYFWAYKVKGQGRRLLGVVTLFTLQQVSVYTRCSRTLLSS